MIFYNVCVMYLNGEASATHKFHGRLKPSSLRPGAQKARTEGKIATARLAAAQRVEMVTGPSG